MSAPNSNEYQQYGNYPPPSVPIGPGGIGHLPPPEKKKSHKGAIIATVVAVVALLIGVGIGTSSAKTDAAGAAGSTNTVTTVTEQGAPGAPGATVTETETATVQQTVEKTIIPKPVVKTVEKTATVKVTAGPPPAESSTGQTSLASTYSPGPIRARTPSAIGNGCLVPAAQWTT